MNDFKASTDNNPHVPHRIVRLLSRSAFSYIQEERAVMLHSQEALRTGIHMIIDSRNDGPCSAIHTACFSKISLQNNHRSGRCG